MNAYIQLIIGMILTIASLLPITLGLVPYWYEDRMYALEECLGQDYNPMPTSVNCYKICWYYIDKVECENYFKRL